MPVYQYKCMVCGHEFQCTTVEQYPICKSFRLGQRHAVANFSFCNERGRCVKDPIDVLRRQYMGD